MRKCFWSSCMLIAFWCAHAEAVIGPGEVWPSTPPPFCPFPQSPTLGGLQFTGNYAYYGGGDSCFMSWAADGNLYSCYADGAFNGVLARGELDNSGVMVLSGNDPMNLQITVPNNSTVPGNSGTYVGRYPCATLVYNGIWYHGTYCVDPVNFEYRPDTGLWHCFPILGPFVGFSISNNFGHSWTVPSDLTPSSPLFDEGASSGDPFKLGMPTIVDFGQNMEHSPDGKVYMICHGATENDPWPRYQNLSWGTADQLYLIRVALSSNPHSINNFTNYEFYAGVDENDEPVWTSDFNAIEPLVRWNNRLGTASITYNAPLDKYLMAVTDGRTTCGNCNTYILESDEMTGPWNLVTYMRDFGSQGNMVSIPSKFISEDGMTFWLNYSANFAPAEYSNDPLISNPPGSAYGLNLREVNLVLVPEPSTIVFLVMGILCALSYFWRHL